MYCLKVENLFYKESLFCFGISVICFTHFLVKLQRQPQLMYLWCSSVCPFVKSFRIYSQMVAIFYRLHTLVCSLISYLSKNVVFWPWPLTLTYFLDHPMLPSNRAIPSLMVYLIYHYSAVLCLFRAHLVKILDKVTI